MKAALFAACADGKWLVLMLAALVLAGCVTPKIDWAARVGNYTYDQAIMELGPPEKSAKLTDGAIVADWLTRHAQTIIAPEPYFAPPNCYYGSFTPMYSETYMPARYLRLTFGADGKLTTWKEFTR
jgi:hypothetical protein